MIVNRDIEQNSLEWLQLRLGIPTASEFDNLLTPKFELRTGEMPRSYLARKVAEKWTGSPLPNHMSIDMDLGKILEEEAVPFYEFTYGQAIDRVGFVTTDDGRVGCSPDGLIGEGGIEIKCPEAHTHAGYLLAGIVPPHYLCQVHGSMYVTGAPWWKFMSYRRGFPPLMLTVERDDAIQEKIHEALELFLPKLDRAMARIEELNGGPPTRQPAPVPDEQPEEEVGITP